VKLKEEHKKMKEENAKLKDSLKIDSLEELDRLKKKLNEMQENLVRISKERDDNKKQLSNLQSKNSSLELSVKTSETKMIDYGYIFLLIF
jgi:hypothetical protein